jgi:hypothetical protein
VWHLTTRNSQINSRLNITRSTWRCNFGRTANIATRTCRRIPRKRASAAMNAPSARTAPRQNSTMSVQTAAADLRRGRLGLRGNGAPACRWKSTRHRPSACIFPTVSMRSLRILLASGIFRRRSAELFPPSLRAKRSNPAPQAQMDCFVACAPRNDGIIRPAISCLRLRRSRRDSRRPGTSHGSQGNRRLPETSA